MGLIDQIEQRNMEYAFKFSDLYNKLSEKQGKELGESPGNPVFTDDINLHRMPTTLDNMYGFLKVETSAHYKTMDSRFNVTNQLIGELIDITYQMWGESQEFSPKDLISESNSALSDAIKELNTKFYKESERYHKNSLSVLQELLDETEDPEPVELDPKQHKEFKDKFDKMSDKLSKVSTVVSAGFKTAAGAFTNTLLTYGTNYYDNEFTNKIADGVENVESKLGSGVDKIGQLTSGLTSGLKDITNSLTGGLGNLMDIYSDSQVKQAFAKYGTRGMSRAEELYDQRIDIMKELIRDYGYSESEAKRVATQEMTKTGTRDYTRLTYEQKLSDRRDEMDYAREIQKRRQQEQRDWSQSALLSAVEIFKTPKQIATAQEQIYEMDRIMPGLNFQATEFYQTMISVFDDTGKMGKEMFEEIRDLSKNLMVDPQTLLNIGNTYTKYLKLMTKGGIGFQKQMTNVIKVTAKLEDQFIDSQGVFGEINEIGFTMLSNMSDDLLTKTQLYARELGMSVTEFQKTARSAPAEAAELLLSAKRGYAERMGIDVAGGDIGEREMALLQQIGITGFESITEFLEQSQADLSKSEKALAADQGTELGPLQRQIELSNEAWERQLTLLDREYDRRTNAWETEQKILHDWENTYYTGWEKRQKAMDDELLQNDALDTWNSRLKDASMGLTGLGSIADATATKLQVAGTAMFDGVGSLLGSLIGTIGGKAIGGIGGKLFGKGKTAQAATSVPAAGTIDVAGGSIPQEIGGAGAKGSSISWSTIAKDFTIIAGGIALVAGTIGILGTIDTKVFKNGAENTKAVGEGFSELYEPVGIVLVASTALGFLFEKTPVNFETIIQGLGAIELGIIGVAAPIGAIGAISNKFDPDMFKSGAKNAMYIGQAMRSLYEPVGIILGASAVIGTLLTATGSTGWLALAEGLVAIEVGIAGVAIPIGVLGQFDPEIFQKGALNAELIGQAMRSLYEPVGIIIAASTALGALFISTGGMAAGAMVAGLIGIEAGIAGVAAPIGLLGKIDTQTFVQGKDNAQLIGEAMDSLYKPVSLTVAAAMALGGIFTGTLGIGWVAMKSGLEGMHTSLNEIGSAIKDFGNKVKGVDTGMVANAANAGLLLTKLQENLPKEGGFFSLFTGKKKSISEFGTELVSFGKGLKNFGEEIKDLSSESINNSSKLIDFIIGIDYDKINDIDSKKFKNKLQDIAEGIKSYATIDFDKFKDIATQLTFTMKFTDLDSGEVGNNIVTIIDLNSLQNELFKEFTKSLYKRIDNLTNITNSQLQIVNSNLISLKSSNIQSDILKAIDNITTGFKPFWDLVKDAKEGNNLFNVGRLGEEGSNKDPYAKYGITSKFGPRKPVAGLSGYHKGTDYALPKGTPISAFDNGIVVKNSYDSKSGNYVILENPEGYKFSFCHLNSRSPLSIGDEIKPGSTIGYSGNTGASTGPHLHLGIRNPKGDFIDPQKYFESNPAKYSSLRILNDIFTKIGIIKMLTDFDETNGDIFTGKLGPVDLSWMRLKEVGTSDISGYKKTTELNNKEWAYGAYQFTAKGSMDNTKQFINWMMNNGYSDISAILGNGLISGHNGKLFDRWKQAYNRDPQRFKNAQDAFEYYHFVAPLLNKYGNILNPLGSKVVAVAAGHSNWMGMGGINSIMKRISGNTAQDYMNAARSYIRSLKNYPQWKTGWENRLNSEAKYLGVHEAGLSKVPYDNYPALLHKDERVLNASEARLWNNVQESRMGNYEPSVQDVTVYVDTDAVIDSIGALTDVVKEIHDILKPKTHAPVQQTIRPKSNLITQYV